MSSKFIFRTLIALFFLLTFLPECNAQNGKYLVTWRNFLTSISALANTENKDHYWSGEIEREFNKGFRLGLAFATAKRSHNLPNSYTVEANNYFQKSTSIGLGGKIYNVNSTNDIKLQGGLYAYLNWLDYRDVFQTEHFYGIYQEEIGFEEKAFPSFLVHIALLHQVGSNIEVEYAFQVSSSKNIENVRKGRYYLASSGSVFGETGLAAQFHLNFKYAIFKPKE